MDNKCTVCTQLLQITLVQQYLQITSKRLFSATEIWYFSEFCYSASLVNFEGQYIYEFFGGFKSFNQHSDDNDDDYDDGDVDG